MLLSLTIVASALASQEEVPNQEYRLYNLGPSVRLYEGAPYYPGGDNKRNEHPLLSEVWKTLYEFRGEPLPSDPSDGKPQARPTDEGARGLQEGVRAGGIGVQERPTKATEAEPLLGQGYPADAWDDGRAIQALGPVPREAEETGSYPAARSHPSERFSLGYTDRADGEAYLLSLLDHIVEEVIPCESSWQADPEGFHLGLAQFDPGTWASARRAPDADYRDPYEQGWAVAEWISRIKGREGTKAGWPSCW